MLALEHLLQPFGLDLTSPPRRKVKLVRHMDSRVDVGQLYREGKLDLYQAYQSAPVFQHAELVLSFLGRGERQATFVGVFDVGDVSPPGTVKPLQPLPMDVSGDYHHALTRRPGFNALIDRLVIDWGPGTRSWHQWFEPLRKPVVEVLPEGHLHDFPGYLNVVLSFAELVRMVKHPTANREWHRMLGSVAGVYLVLDTRTGRQYVGSASGEDGLIGRWRSYAENGHAGNRQLKAIADEDHASIQHFQFSILQTLDRALTRQEVIAYESLHKLKLGSRVHGLNDN
jgi:hypothetical protein